jgi:hypothetical protein
MAYIKLEALNEAQKIETVGRKSALATINDKLQKELDKRNLSEVPTDKLIQLIVLLNRQMDDQNIKLNSITFQTGL